MNGPITLLSHDCRVAETMSAGTNSTNSPAIFALCLLFAPRLASSFQASRLSRASTAGFSFALGHLASRVAWSDASDLHGRRPSLRRRRAVHMK